MHTCYIGLGSNIGDRRSYIDEALSLLAAHPGIKVLRVSSIYQTDPVSGIPQGKYLNGVAEIGTSLHPKHLLEVLLHIEAKLGRVRLVKDGPRTIDLDILYYGDEFYEDGELTIPHPRICQREFVLRGLRELGRV